MKKTAAVILALTMIPALCACGSKAQTQTTPAPTQSAQTQTYPQLVKSGDTVKADLNGDGTAEEICLNTTDKSPDTQPAITSFKINGTELSDKIYAAGYSSNTHEDSYYAITDIDAADGKLEIAVMDYGPSDDLYTGFFRWDGKAIQYLGVVSGILPGVMQSNNADGYDVSGVTFDGKGVVHSYVRLDVLQTWFASADWKIGSDGKLAVVPQELYYPVGGKTYPVTALNDVTLYAKNDLKSETTTLKTGEKLTITATDNAQWVLAENAAGAECWLHLSEGGQSVDTPAGAVYASQAFDGLVFAD